MSRAGNVWDNSAMESVFSSLKTERTARKVYRTRDEARADVFDYIERFYNPRRRHSKPGDLSPTELEARASLTRCPRNRQQLIRAPHRGAPFAFGGAQAPCLAAPARLHPARPGG